MSTDPEAPLLKALEAIADGSPVDWEELNASTGLRSRVAKLRALETLAAAHRDLGENPPRAGSKDTPLFAWGSLRVIEKIGEGSFGEVFRAFDPDLQREVALKLRHPDVDASEAGARRWLSEARRLARVRHPNVLAVHGVGIHDGRAGMWTELLAGRTLEDVLAESGPLSADEAALIGLDLCRAMAAVHEAGLVHGDIKASNVMREGGRASGRGASGSGRIVLMDFGAARESLGASGPPLGTPLTSAPEVLSGDAPTPASDVYSLGALLFRLVTAEHPVRAASISELRERLAEDPIPSLRDRRPDLPAWFIPMVERALSPDPLRRFRTAGETERELSAALGSAGVRSRRPRRRWLAAAAAAALVLTGLFVWNRQAERSRPAEGGPTATSVPPGGEGVSSDAPGGGPAPSAGVTPGAATDPSDLSSTTSVSSLVSGFSMHRSRGGIRRPVADGGDVRPGDLLSLELWVRQPAFTYVVNEDERGRAFVLFPLPDFEKTNPLSAGERHRLPGRRGGVETDWQVTSAGGMERFLVVVSPQALEVLEPHLRALPRAAPGQKVEYSELDFRTLQDPRGVSGLSESSPAPSAAAEPAIRRLSRVLRERESDPERLWIREIALLHAAP